MAKIKATRGGETREFDAEFWAALPADKHGWKTAAEKPEVLKEKEKKDKTKEKQGDAEAGK